MNFFFAFPPLRVWSVLRVTVFMLFGKLLMSETALGCGIRSLVWNITLLICDFFFLFLEVYFSFSPLFQWWNKLSALHNRSNNFSLIVQRPFKQRIEAIFPYGGPIVKAEWWVFHRVVLTSPMLCSYCFDLFALYQRLVEVWVGVF